MQVGDDPYDWLKDQGEDSALLELAQTGFATSWDPEVVGVAVSGGGDSMAMLHLMARAAPHSGWRLEAVTVDHRLRPEAADEAAFVAETCARLGVPHQTLTWVDHPATGNLMQAASRARYALIAEWAKSRHVEFVAVGHTADDQAETFLMGLAREAGLDGLSGMREDWDVDGISFRRPFIRTCRAALRAYLIRHGLAWRDDPSNDDVRYARVQARRALEALKPMGITAERLGRTILHLGMVRNSLRGVLRDKFLATGREEAGALLYPRRDFGSLHPEMDRLLLVTALRWLSSAPHPPRAASVDRLRRAVAMGRDSTLAGCCIHVTQDCLQLSREPRAAGGPVPVGTLWDNRWIVEGPPGEVRALGPRGLPQVKGWRDLGLPRDVLLVTPAVWDGDILLAAPVAGMENGWKARIATPFHRFLVSD